MIRPADGIRIPRLEALREPARPFEPYGKFVAPPRCLHRQYQGMPPDYRVCPKRIPAAQSVSDAVYRFFVLALIAKRAEQTIPDNEKPAVVLIDVARVFGVVHAMIGGRDQQVIQHTQPIHMLGMHPKLIDQVQGPDGDHHVGWRARQIHRQVKDKANVICAGLPQRGA